MKNRNVLVELARFLFSILVVGYHVQMSMNNDVADFFENGALAVEFFFLISGYFLARSIEKISASKNRRNTAVETWRFMKNKVKGILPTHITAIIVIIIVILACNFTNAGNILLKGLPSVFLLQGGALWYNGYADALIVPEWYLSSMLLSMLFIFPIGLLLRKKLKGPWVTLIVLVIVAVPALAFGLPFGFNTNLVYYLRAWGEMCVGMFAYYLASVMAKHELKKPSAITLKVLEILCYAAPVVLGIVPMSAGMQPVCMAVSVVCVFTAISITFANKGVSITNEKLAKVFAYLGSISLAIYLFHPVIISLLDYVWIGCELWVKMLITFPSAILLAVIFRLVCFGINKLIKHIKNKQEKVSI
ncbi:MAG: acyltransferase [Ruminococcus flavefaciens]|nr:acyltransferase [Ruminococcus flavefaciens]